MVNSEFAKLILCGIMPFLKQYITKDNLLGFLVILICAVFISVTSAFYPDDNAVSLSVVARIVVFTAVFSVILSLFFFGSLKFLSKEEMNITINKFTFCKTFIFLFCIYAFVLIVYYPGVCGWDTEYQLVDLFDGTQIMHRDCWGDYYVTYFLSDHMNLFDTFLFGVFVKLGMLIDNVSFGVFVYCLLQAALFAYSCSHLTLKIREWGAGKICSFISFTFFFLSPFVWLYSINMIKDSINAALFMLYFISFICILRGEKKHGLKLIVLSLLVSLTKKTGIIIVVPTNLILTIFVFKKSNLKLRTEMVLSTIVPVLIISVLLNKILYPAFNIYQDEAIETFGFSLQQIARLIKYHPEALSKSDLEIIDAVVPVETLAEKYNYNLTDGVKDTYRPLASNGQLLNFFILWFKNAFLFPLTYIKSLIGTNGGFFSTNGDIYVYTEFRDWGNLGVHMPSSLNKYREFVSELYLNLSSVPLINVFFTLSLYSWILPCFMIFKAVKQKSPQIMVCSIPVILSIITFILSPTVNARYALHIIMLAPLLFSLSSRFFREIKVIDKKFDNK